MKMKEFTDELVSEEEVKEIMTGAGYYAGCGRFCKRGM